MLIIFDIVNFRPITTIFYPELNIELEHIWDQMNRYGKIFMLWIMS